MNKKIPGLTPARFRHLKAIVELTVSGWPATIREVMDQTGIKSSNGVRTMLKVLEREGYIERHPSQGAGRGIRPTQKGVRATLAYRNGRRPCTM